MTVRNTPRDALYPSCRRTNPNFIQRIYDTAALYRQRRALARLEDWALRDLGLNRSEVETEVARPFWDVPTTWRR